MKRVICLLIPMALLAAACGDDDGGTAAEPVACEAGETDGNLDLYNWSEYIDPDLIPAFEAEYGVSVTETFFESNEVMLAQIQAGGAAYDLIVPSDYMVSIMAEEGMLIPLTKAAIPNLANLDPKFTGLPFDPTGDYSAPYQWGTTGIGFAYEALGEDFEPSWAVIFDPDPSYVGQISMLNDAREALGAALKYLGYSVNTTSEAELQEAVDLLKSIKPAIAKFDSDQYEDDLVGGEVMIAHGWSGDFFFAFDDTDGWEDFGYFIPEEGAVAWVDNMAIPRTADAVCTAHTFIDFMLDAENGAALTNYNFYASPNAAAAEFVDPEILGDESIYPPDDVFERLEFIADTGAFELKFQDAFTDVKN
ncbi:MAG: spermidine/putrescine ABC transporter substrate-binding protein [Actinobacteria bacterium]|nr:spermidine/putrescine ABC transporter substrate-binding protein [Actinomycetota bacterium]MBU1493501.1 spermidine/putrescine ABC transporter substrate-binding protein [Actinomycetota bacterium]MBU1866631.1 spermidine/putrescine ABC transporter substrate-binding protein [Actinomycetota bacterium]